MVAAAARRAGAAGVRARPLRAPSERGPTTGTAMSPSRSEPRVRLAVVGNPANRRVALFRAAARARRPAPHPRVVAWRDVAGGGAGFGTGEPSYGSTRPGEDAEVDRLLRGAAEPAEPGEIVGLAPWYRGFAGAAGPRSPRPPRGRGAAARRPGRDPGHVRQAALPRPAGRGRGPRAAAPPRGRRSRLRASCGDGDAATPAGAGCSSSRAHGSSASGVLALRDRPARGRVAGRPPRSSVDAGGRLFNSLRVRRYARRARRRRDRRRARPGRAARRALAAQGRAATAGPPTCGSWWSPAGPPTRWSATSRSPDDQPAPRRRARRPRRGPRGRRAAGGAGPRRWRACERAAACFPGTLYVGRRPAARHRLAALRGRRGQRLRRPAAPPAPAAGSGAEGLDTYAAQVAAYCTTDAVQRTAGSAPRPRPSRT